MNETQSTLLDIAPEPQKPDKRRFVTVLYEIVDDAAWKGVNPLQYEHNGLKSIGVSAGDLMALHEDIEAIVQDGERLDYDGYRRLYDKHVMSSFPGRSRSRATDGMAELEKHDWETGAMDRNHP